MGCTTILVGKNASYDGSTMVARTEDSPSGVFRSKKFINVSPEEQPRKYKSVISKVEIELPNNPVRYTAVPNAILDNGIWGQCGANEYNVSMSATETITSNERVLGADPLVEYRPAVGNPGDVDYVPEQVGGIGEEDIYTIVMPYIARHVAFPMIAMLLCQTNLVSINLILKMLLELKKSTCALLI